VCLAVPGRVVSIDESNADAPGAVGTVDFQGSQVDASLAMVPDVAIGDWVLVHAGFAISKLDEAEARQTWEYLRDADVAECRGVFPGGEGSSD
jgi:hydrogenase expression/formation protein HypC